MKKNMGLMLLLAAGLSCSNKDSAKEEVIPQTKQKQPLAAPSTVSPADTPLVNNNEIKKTTSNASNDSEIKKNEILDNSKPTPGTSGGGQGNGEPVPEAPPGPPPPPPSTPQNVPTPPQYETQWTFYNYCVIAENTEVAEQLAKDFKDREHFESWLGDIQHTVAMIRVQLGTPADLTDVFLSCQKAYGLFKRVTGLDLTGKNIVNIDPISGYFPRLKTLVLSNNQIVNITFLRNLPFLESLFLTNNLIPDLPIMVQINTPDPSVVTPCQRSKNEDTGVDEMPAWVKARMPVSFQVLVEDPATGQPKPVAVKITKNNIPCGWYSLSELGLEVQNAAMAAENGIQPDLGLSGLGILPLFTDKLAKIRTDKNVVDPSGLRGHNPLLLVSNPDSFMFTKGTPTCVANDPKQGLFPYPTALETQRAKLCK